MIMYRSMRRKIGLLLGSTTSRPAIASRPPLVRVLGKEKKLSRWRLESDCPSSKLDAKQDQSLAQNEQQTSIEAALRHRQLHREATSGRVSVKPAACVEYRAETNATLLVRVLPPTQQEMTSESECAAIPSPHAEGEISGLATNRRHYQKNRQSSVIKGEITSTVPMTSNNLKLSACGARRGSCVVRRCKDIRASVKGGSDENRSDKK